jgi:tellurite methyltransferase
MEPSDRERWDAKYAARGPELGPPSAFVVDVLPRLPTRGRCLDVAGGSGRQALALARHGLDVTIADVSPVGLAQAQRHAAAAGLEIRTLAFDIETSGLPPGPWDVIVCVHFLYRPLFSAAATALVPGGFLVFEHPTRTNLERHDKPSAHYVLEDGELPGLVDARLDVLRLEEGWGPEGRHEARLLARRRALA